MLLINLFAPPRISTQTLEIKEFKRLNKMKAPLVMGE